MESLGADLTQTGGHWLKGKPLPSLWSNVCPRKRSKQRKKLKESVYSPQITCMWLVDCRFIAQSSWACAQQPTHECPDTDHEYDCSASKKMVCTRWAVRGSECFIMTECSSIIHHNENIHGWADVVNWGSSRGCILDLHNMLNIAEETCIYNNP